jgi:hypothetical protein
LHGADPRRRGDGSGAWDIAVSLYRRPKDAVGGNTEVVQIPEGILGEKEEIGSGIFQDMVKDILYPIISDILAEKVAHVADEDEIAGAELLGETFPVELGLESLGSIHLALFHEPPSPTIGASVGASGDGVPGRRHLGEHLGHDYPSLVHD